MFADKTFNLTTRHTVVMTSVCGQMQGKFVDIDKYYLYNLSLWKDNYTVVNREA
jgi:hypothetical protein